MKTVGQLLATRNTEINTAQHRRRLALRDHPDYSNDEVKQPEPVETIVSHVYVHDMASMRQIRKLYNLESQVIALKKILNERFDKIGEYTIE